MLIAEELLLLALDPVKGTLVHHPRRDVLMAAAGALVAELAFEGRVDLAGKRIVAQPTPDRSLPSRVQQVLAGPDSGRRAATQLLHVEDVIDLWAVLVDGLVDRNILGRRRDRLLFWQVTRHPTLDPAPRALLVERLQAALLSGESFEPRTAALLALCDEGGITAVSPPDRRDRAARLRSREATDATPVALIVRQAIALTQADG